MLVEQYVFWNINFKYNKPLASLASWMCRCPVEVDFSRKLFLNCILQAAL